MMGRILHTCVLLPHCRVNTKQELAALEYVMQKRMTQRTPVGVMMAGQGVSLDVFDATRSFMKERRRRAEAQELASKARAYSPSQEAARKYVGGGGRRCTSDILYSVVQSTSAACCLDCAVRTQVFEVYAYIYSRHPPPADLRNPHHPATSVSALTGFCAHTYVHHAAPCVRRAATDALRKKQMGVMAGFGRLMDDFVQQMNSTVAGVPENMVTVSGLWLSWEQQRCCHSFQARGDGLRCHNSSTLQCNFLMSHATILCTQVGKRKRSVRWDMAAAAKQRGSSSPAPGGEDWFLVPPERALVPVSLKAADRL
jgi:hypothetical protein